jgi:hypothetical protein
MKYLFGALALILPSGAFASDIAVQMAPASPMNVVILGDGGQLVGPLIVYRSNGERLLDPHPGVKIENSETSTST